MTKIRNQRAAMLRFANLITQGIEIGLSRDQGVDIILEVVAKHRGLNDTGDWFSGDHGDAIMDEIELRFTAIAGTPAPEHMH